jgi:hypothetical protein
MDVALLDFSQGKTRAIEADALVIHEGAQGYQQGSQTRFSFSERGIAQIDMPLTGQNRRGTLADSMVVSMESVEERLRSSLTFYGQVIEHLDPYGRHQRFLFNAAILKLGYRTLERAPEPRQSYVMRTAGGDAPILAYTVARTISRQDLSAPESEIERTTALLARGARGG